MRRLMLTAAMAAATAAVLSGCGQPRAAQATGGPGSPSSSTPAGTGAGCHGARTAGRGHGLTVSLRDNGRSVCVAPGTTILVVLQGTPDRRWAPIQASSGVLARRPDGRLALVVGATGASFAAVRAGRDIITSARPVCAGPGPAGSSPSPASSEPSAGCHAELAFRVVVVVRR